MLRRIFNYGKEVEYFAEIMEDKNKIKIFDFLEREDGINKFKVNFIDKTSEESELCKLVLNNIGRAKVENVEDPNEISKINYTNKENDIYTKHNLLVVDDNFRIISKKKNLMLFYSW